MENITATDLFWASEKGKRTVDCSNVVKEIVDNSYNEYAVFGYVSRDFYLYSLSGNCDDSLHLAKSFGSFTKSGVRYDKDELQQKFEELGFTWSTQDATSKAKEINSNISSCTKVTISWGTAVDVPPSGEPETPPSSQDGMTFATDGDVRNLF